jgi:DNA (cytosine-5)-methyltransferase 1
MNYYNENDPRAAAWLKELISASLIPDGFVDDRSISEIKPHELAPYTQCPFFARIGGWSLAPRLAGWPDERPVWTGSCPCQPFSVAGKGLCEADERHLWPIFRELIRECSPPVIFGEQVASAAGKVWLAGVFADLENMAYRRAGADLCAAGVGAPHIRQRLFWVADAAGAKSRGGKLRLHAQRRGDHGASGVEELAAGEGTAAQSCGVSGVGLASDECGRGAVGGCGASGLEHAARDGWEQRRAESGGRGALCGCGVVGVGDADRSEKERLGPVGVPMESEQKPGRSGNANAWSDFYVVGCADRKTRRIGTGVQPLAHGVSGRVGLLRGYGNAIVPRVAAEFIGAYLDVRSDVLMTDPMF